MASLQTPLLAALILLAVILQATEAGEAGKREGSLQRSRSDTGVPSSCGRKSTELRAEDSNLPLALGLVPLLLWTSVYTSVKWIVLKAWSLGSISAGLGVIVGMAQGLLLQRTQG